MYGKCHSAHRILHALEILLLHEEWYIVYGGNEGRDSGGLAWS